jgi:8-oxo-dGTP pyrophosphatase MutT (NUDIX family)
MAKKQGRIIKLAEFREPHEADGDVTTSGAESGTDSRSETLIGKPRKGGQRPLRHWTFQGWTAVSPPLVEMMRSPTTAPPVMRGTAMLESGAVAYRRLKNGKLLILLVSKKRSKKWGIPKGKVNASLSFGETAAKEAFEEAGVIGRISPNSVGMFRARKELPSQKTLKSGFTCWKWIRRFQIGPRRESVRLDGLRAKPLPESFANRYSHICVTASRRSRITGDAQAGLARPDRPVRCDRA